MVVHSKHPSLYPLFIVFNKHLPKLSLTSLLNRKTASSDSCWPFIGCSRLPVSIVTLSATDMTAPEVNDVPSLLVTLFFMYTVSMY